MFYFNLCNMKLLRMFFLTVRSYRHGGKYQRQTGENKRLYHTDQHLKAVDARDDAKTSEHEQVKKNEH